MLYFNKRIFIFLNHKVIIDKLIKLFIYFRKKYVFVLETKTLCKIEYGLWFGLILL